MICEGVGVGEGAGEGVSEGVGEGVGEGEGEGVSEGGDDLPAEALLEFVGESLSDHCSRLVGCPPCSM